MVVVLRKNLTKLCKSSVNQCDQMARLFFNIGPLGKLNVKNAKDFSLVVTFTNGWPFLGRWPSRPFCSLVLPMEGIRAGINAIKQFCHN